MSLFYSLYLCAVLGSPVYALCWARDSDHILYTSGRQLVIKPLQAAAKPLQVSNVILMSTCV